ncbi:hypothetical protein O0L34_g1543 [Tuta absoluta]|nr:hypothetical protein O0L34_g1543 [Tuta absoluta]
MQALLEFMYKGEVHVSQDALSSFLKSGENLQVKGLSMEMSQDAWVKQQTQQSGDRHQTRIKTSPVSGSGNCEAQEATSQHTATFAPILPQYGIPIHGSGSIGRYAPPAHVPLHPTSHRRPAQPKPSPSQSPHARNYRQSSSSSHCGSVADEPDTRSSPGAGQRFDDNNQDCTSTLGNPVKNNGYERSGSANDERIEHMSNDQGAAEDLRVKSENDYHQSGYNNSPPPTAPIPTTNFHEKPLATSPVPPKPTPDIWPTKIITSKSGGIATADGKKLKCPYCERLYGYETNLRAHIRQRHQGIRVPCPHCSRTFTRNNTVRRHIAREHRHQVTPHTPHGAHGAHTTLHAAQPPLSNHTQ